MGKQRVVENISHKYIEVSTCFNQKEMDWYGYGANLGHQYLPMDPHNWSVSVLNHMSNLPHFRVNDFEHGQLMISKMDSIQEVSYQTWTWSFARGTFHGKWFEKECNTTIFGSLNIHKCKLFWFEQKAKSRKVLTGILCLKLQCRWRIKAACSMETLSFREKFPLPPLIEVGKSGYPSCILWCLLQFSKQP